MGDTTPIKDSVVLGLLECPVCLDLCQSPVYMCTNGHNVCADCKEKLRECPVCRVRGAPSNRNRALEAISDEVLTVPCKFKPQGCAVKRKRAEDLESHYPKCRFQLYQCGDVHTGCDFVGRSVELYGHIREMHPLTMLTRKEIRALSFDTDKDWIYGFMYKWDGEEEYFLVIVRYWALTSCLYFYSRYVGPQHCASEFKIRMKITSPDAKSTIYFCDKKCLDLQENFLTSEKTGLLRGCDFDKVNGKRQIWFNIESIMKI